MTNVILAFASSQRGSDSLRYNIALKLKRRGFLPASELMLFIGGKSTRVKILDFKIIDYPNIDLSRKPHVDHLAEQAFDALGAGNGAVAEAKLRRATELEPDALSTGSTCSSEFRPTT